MAVMEDVLLYSVRRGVLPRATSSYLSMRYIARWPKLLDETGFSAEESRAGAPQ